MQQENLFAVPRQPVKFTASWERLWLEGDDVWEVQTSQTSTKATQALWRTSERLSGATARLIVPAIIEARLAVSLSPRWDQEPQPQSQQAWEDGLTVWR